MNEAHNDPVIEMKVEIRKKGTRDLDGYGRAQNMILLQVLINLDKLLNCVHCIRVMYLQHCQSTSKIEDTLLDSGHVVWTFC
jgi:hypothetical protein